MLPDCCEVDHNFAWFEPIYCDCTEESPYSTGAFFSFQQLFVSATRSDEAPGRTDFGDSTNGSRYDFGYMYERTGWFASILKINNPGVRLIDGNVDRNAVEVLDLAGNAIGETFETLNGFNVYGAELNHVWRMEPTYRGVLLEPFLGLRYIRFRDHFDTATYDLFTAAIPGSGPPNTVVSFSDVDFYTIEETTTDNDMFGGQFGMRVGRRRGRWLLNVDMRGFTFHNFVTRSSVTTVDSNEQIIAGDLRWDRHADRHGRRGSVARNRSCRSWPEMWGGSSTVARCGPTWASRSRRCLRCTWVASCWYWVTASHGATSTPTDRSSPAE